jgi:hypothetical protein
VGWQRQGQHSNLLVEAVAEYEIGVARRNAEIWSVDRRPRSNSRFEFSSA